MKDLKTSSILCSVAALIGVLAGPGRAAENSWTHGGRLAGPTARAWPGMANDQAHQRVVLFGGYDGTTQVGDTWTWDGTAWSQSSPTASPSPREGAMMAYDATRGQVVLFGGEDSFGFFDDTWTWDGSNWTQAHPLTSPPGVWGEGMTFDVATRLIVLFTGFSTWTWDGVDWKLQRPSASPPRRDLGEGFARAGSDSVLFGGVKLGEPTDTLYRDTWTWDGTTWIRQHSVSRPSARTGLGLSYDQAWRETLLFGGAGPAGALDDTWTWNGGVWSRLSPGTSPPARASMGIAYDSSNRQVVLFGGVYYDNGKPLYLTDTWIWDGTNWAQPLAVRP